MCAHSTILKIHLYKKELDKITKFVLLLRHTLGN